MGMFEKIFGRLNTDKAIKGYFSTLTAYNPTFTSRAGGLYEMDITRSAVHAVATHCSKLKPHVLGKNNKRLEKMLQYKPNPWQVTSQFLYRLATILEVCNTAFIVPLFDKAGRTVGIYPVVPEYCEICEGIDGNLYLRYKFASGKTAAVEYDKCGVMTKMQFKSDIFGESNTALSPTLDLISMQNQGIENGIRQGAAIRFMAKLGQSVRPEDMKKERENFKIMNFGMENNGGVMMFDTKYAEVKQIDSKPYIVDADQMKMINENVYTYFGVNEKILKNMWDEETWTAFYEGRIEPFALQLSLVLTNMFFSETEFTFGNAVEFSANRLQFATTKNKTDIIVQLFDRGMLSFNEGREILQMPPVEGGDKYMIRGEYVSRDDKTEKVEELEDA